MRNSKAITISLPVDLVAETQRVAKEEARTRSDILREALKEYLASRRWRRLREWGTAAAERLGLHSEADLTRLIEKSRLRRRRTSG